MHLVSTYLTLTNTISVSLVPWWWSCSAGLCDSATMRCVLCCSHEIVHILLYLVVELECLGLWMLPAQNSHKYKKATANLWTPEKPSPIHTHTFELFSKPWKREYRLVYIQEQVFLFFSFFCFLKKKVARVFVPEISWVTLNLSLFFFSQKFKVSPFMPNPTPKIQEKNQQAAYIYI